MSRTFWFFALLAFCIALPIVGTVEAQRCGGGGCGGSRGCSGGSCASGGCGGGSCGPGGCAPSFYRGPSSCASGQCGGPSYVQTPQYVQAPATYRWIKNAYDPDCFDLYHGQKFLGVWRNSSEKYCPCIQESPLLYGKFHDEPFDHRYGKAVNRPVESNGNNSANNKSSLPKKDGAIGQLQPWQLKGVNETEMCRHERFTRNGKNISYEEYKDGITKGTIADDSAKAYVSVWAKDSTVRARAVEQLKKDPALWSEIESKCHHWWGEAANPSSFHATDWRSGASLYCVDRGEPCVLVQDPTGKVLWRADNFNGDTTDMLKALRKVDPKNPYNPDLSPGPHRPGPGPGPNGGAEISMDTLVLFGLIGLGIVLFLMSQQRKP